MTIFTLLIITIAIEVAEQIQMFAAGKDFIKDFITDINFFADDVYLPHINFKFNYV